LANHRRVQDKDSIYDIDLYKALEICRAESAILPQFLKTIRESGLFLCQNKRDTRISIARTHTLPEIVLESRPKSISEFLFLAPKTREKMDIFLPVPNPQEPLEEFLAKDAFCQFY